MIDISGSGSGIEALHEILEMVEEYRRIREPHLALDQAKILRACVNALVVELVEDTER